MNKFQLYCSCIYCKFSVTAQNLSAHYARHERAKPCAQCGKLIMSGKFCSTSCSAIFNNKLRTPESRIKSGITLLTNKKKLGWEPKLKTKLPSPVKSRTCVVCGKIDTTTRRFQSDKCMFCNDSLTYRESCKFTFNLKDYPAEFNLALLTEHGMFNPKNNQSGVSRDHRLSVSYGKTNRIDPKIISHPANCQLMTQTENKKKQHHSSITVDELLRHIAAWDTKYKDAGSGHAPENEGL